MEKRGSKSNKGVTISDRIKLGALIVAVLLAFIPFQAQAGDTVWSSPAVGQTCTLYPGDSVTINMKNHNSLVAHCVGKASRGKGELYGTDSQGALKLVHSFRVTLGVETRVDSAVFWQKSASDPNPKLRFLCSGRKAYDVTIKEVK